MWLFGMAKNFGIIIDIFVDDIWYDKTIAWKNFFDRIAYIRQKNDWIENFNVFDTEN